MNALTREALSPVARGCRRDMGGVGASPRLAWRAGHGRVACRAVDSGIGSRTPIAG
jgi:hypothetical protein